MAATRKKRERRMEVLSFMMVLSSLPCSEKRVSRGRSLCE
jgi:hypothetical protein